MISVDENSLAKAFGMKSWTEPLRSDHQRMAMRVITDTHGCKDQDVIVSNATCWIDRAYDLGLTAGIALERKRWREKIAEMFGITGE